MARGNHWMDTK